MSTSGYRPDIDGLRALAILSVLMFHLDVAGFSGGFVGVDVFFVISGFLITRLIRDEVERTGSFSFSRFYIRRARRLFPALFLTLVVCFVVGVALFSPPHLERLGGSLVHAIASISNFFFWGEAGYFDTESAVKPLLHTWSLGVEEQFYLFWPAVLVFLLAKGPRRGAPVMLVIGGVFSLYLNLLFSDGSPPLLQSISTTAARWFEDGRSTIFYLAPFRVFEFAIGATIVWLAQFQPNKRVSSDLLVLMGLVLIFYSIHEFDRETLFPSFSALVPCLGAALVIHSGGNADFLDKLLANKMVVAVGLISYSLYLVHWPLIVYWKYYTFEELSLFDKGLIVVISMAVSYLMYRFVEKPFRRPVVDSSKATDYAYAFFCVLLSLILVVPASHVWANQGWEWRFPAGLREASYGLQERMKGYWYSGGKRSGSFSENTLNVVVIGNSFAIDVVHMLDNVRNLSIFFEGPTSWRCYAFTFPNKPSDPRANKECSAGSQRFSRGYEKADIILLADDGSTWDPGNEKWRAGVEKNIASLRNSSFAGEIVIYGERPKYKKYVHDLVTKFGRLNGTDRFAAQYLELDVAGMRRRVEAAEQYYKEGGIHYFSPIHQLCDDLSCRVLTPNNALIYFDDSHFSDEGDRYLAKPLVYFLQNLAVVRKPSVRISVAESAE